MKAEENKEKETPRLSEMWWNRCKNYYKNQCKQTVFYIEEDELGVLNQLITLEAKIEAFNLANKLAGEWYGFDEIMDQLEVEYEKLGIKHGLI